MLDRAKQMVEEIHTLTQAHAAKAEELKQLVDKYNARRIELALAKLQDRGMTWCTDCFKIVCQEDTGLLFVEGSEQYTCGYEGGDYSFRDFAKLHRACSTCRRRAIDRHGWRGEYNSNCDRQESFSAFQVEKREDGYWVYKFGLWQKLDDENCKLEELSLKRAEELANSLGLLPKIEISCSQHVSDVKLVCAKF